MRNILVLVLALSFVIGCAEQSSQMRSEKKRNTADEIALDFLSEKLKKNGANFLCDQPSYLDCYKISKEQCLKELKPYTIECFNYASEELGGNISEQFAAYFFSASCSNMYLFMQTELKKLPNVLKIHHLMKGR